MGFFKKIFSNNTSHDFIHGYTKRESHQKWKKRTLTNFSNEGETAEKLLSLIRFTTKATFTLLLKRSLNLSDEELNILVKSLRRCGMIADESGHLLPLLFSEISHHTLALGSYYVSYKRLLNIFEITEINTCIHCRSVIADAVLLLAEVTRSPSSTTIDGFTIYAKSIINQNVYKQLEEECQKLYYHLKKEQSKSSKPDCWWQNYYFGPIEEIEKFCTLAESEAVLEKS